MMMQTQAAPRVGKVAGIFDHVQMMHPHEGQSHPHTMHNFIQVTGMLLELSDSVLLDLLRPGDMATGAAALLEKAPLDLPATSSESSRYLPAISARTQGVSARSRTSAAQVSEAIRVLDEDPVRTVQIDYVCAHSRSLMHTHR